MTAAEIRNKFQLFFKEKAHMWVASAPMVVKDDPTLMFTNAGMNQFKDYFLGNKVPPAVRVADTQKCLRVSGKHNDLEEVGIDTYHHTMFEMLGNWSFGDYFKAEAIEWAWQLLTEVFKLPPNRLYATYFGGDATDGLAADTEARNLWLRHLPQDHILPFDKKDNFWEMGDTGPCGPCAEIHIDLRPDKEREKQPGSQVVNQDHPAVIEIWNIVFIQYDRKATGALEPLKQKHIDTGMGFERLVRVVQGKTSNYDTDVFMPLIKLLEKEANIQYGQSETTDIAVRVIADHARAATFAIADGQLPANTGAGYVIRRILRRAIRYGYSYLNFNQPVIYKLTAILAQQFSGVFAEVEQQQAFIEKVIKEEEAAFLSTLEAGLKRINQITEQPNQAKTIDGQTVFELYDTFGFPPDLTRLVAADKGFTIDQPGFEKAMEVQKNRSRKATSLSVGDWFELLPSTQATFVGYDQTTAQTQLVKYRPTTQKDKTIYQLVLAQTPFYAESGGQVGDTGIIELTTATAQVQTIRVFNTIKENDLIIHLTKDKLNLPTDATAVNATAKVNAERRLSITRNHTATHLLHAALRTVLGSHVAQKGSFVGPESLRFDFSHFGKMTNQEIEKTEQLVNQKILENIALHEDRNLPIEQAKAKGAMALFGEKYGDTVRVITFDPTYSVELCGGCHVPATGAIGLFKIKTETAVASGVRRIEAITGTEANKWVANLQAQYNALTALLKNPKDPEKSLTNLLNDNTELTKKVEAAQNQQLTQLTAQLKNKATQTNNLTAIIEQVQLDNADQARKLAFDLRNQTQNLFLVLGVTINGKPNITVMLADNLTNKLHAGEMVKQLAKNIKGGGGGQPFFATAGGKDATGIPAALAEAKKIIETL